MLAEAFLMWHSPFPSWMTTVMVIVVVLMVVSAGQKRRRLMRMQDRICRGCAAPNPPYARFCRRCGRSLE